MGRFKKFYSDREAQMIEWEGWYHGKLSSLLRIIEFTLNGFKALSNSLNPEYRAPYKEDNS